MRKEFPNQLVIQLMSFFNVHICIMYCGQLRKAFVTYSMGTHLHKKIKQDILVIYLSFSNPYVFITFWPCVIYTTQDGFKKCSKSGSLFKCASLLLSRGPVRQEERHKCSIENSVVFFKKTKQNKCVLLLKTRATEIIYLVAYKIKRIQS